MLQQPKKKVPFKQLPKKQQLAILARYKNSNLPEYQDGLWDLMNAATYQKKKSQEEDQYQENENKKNKLPSGQKNLNQVFQEGNISKMVYRLSPEEPIGDSDPNSDTYEGTYKTLPSKIETNLSYKQDLYTPGKNRHWSSMHKKESLERKKAKDDVRVNIKSNDNINMNIFDNPYE